jgi:hypothetical protein
LKGLTVDALHDDVGGLSGVLNAVDGDDILVRHGGGGPSFAHEPLPSTAIGGHVRREHLDRHDPVQFFIKRPEHNSHASAADHLHHFIVRKSPVRTAPFWRGEKVFYFIEGLLLRRRHITGQIRGQMLSRRSVE